MKELMFVVFFLIQIPASVVNDQRSLIPIQETSFHGASGFLQQIGAVVTLTTISNCTYYEPSSNKCLSCERGSYLNSTSNNCFLCPSGTYQNLDKYAGSSCPNCPTQSHCITSACTTYSQSLPPGNPTSSGCAYPILLDNSTTWITAIATIILFIASIIVIGVVAQYRAAFALNVKLCAIFFMLILFIINAIMDFNWVLGLRQSDFQIITSPSIRMIDYWLFAVILILLIFFAWNLARPLTYPTIVVSGICEFSHFFVSLWILASGVSSAPLYFYDAANKNTGQPINIPPLTQYRKVDAIIIALVSLFALIHTFIVLAKMGKSRTSITNLSRNELVDEI